MKFRVLVLCGVLLLTGCAAAEAEPTATPRPVASAPAPEDDYPAPDPDYMRAVLARLGPVPTSVPYTPEQEAQAVAANADLAWDAVARSFPEEPRPGYTVIRQIEPDEYIETIVPCLEARGISVTMTAGDRGFGIDGGTAAVRVGTYLCEVEYPVRPQPPFTEAQLSYLYDYFVQIKTPCIEALGYEISGNALAKADFIAKWPRQGWNPSAANIADEEMAAVELACPNYPAGLR